MGSRGYRFDADDGRVFAVPSPAVLFSPVRYYGEDGSSYDGFPRWEVTFTRSGVWQFRRFGDGDTAYSLEKLDDGSFEFRDVDIDTLMYVMTPVYEAGEFVRYDLAWEEYVTDDRPETCPLEDGLVLPYDEDGGTWGVFRPDFEHLMFPVYSLDYDSTETTEDGGEESVIRYALKYYVDLAFEGGECRLWDYGKETEAAAFTLGEGKYDTQHRRIYALGGVDWSVLFADDGFVLYGGDGDRFGNASVYQHDDDEGFDDGWGMDALSSLALEDYLAVHAGDFRRGRSDELRTEVWNAALDAKENPLDKVMSITRMHLDAVLEDETETWPVEIPPNHYRKVSGAGCAIYSVKSGWEVRDDDGNVLYTVTRTGDSEDAVWNFYSPEAGTKYLLEFVGDGSYRVSANDGTVLYTVVPQEDVSDFGMTGEYSSENLYAELSVLNPDGTEAYTIRRPKKSPDPFDSLTFAEFSDSVPLRKVDGAWVTYAGDAKYYSADSNGVDFWLDLYDRRNILSYRISKPSMWDDDDREIYSVDGTLVAAMSTSALVSGETGKQIAKMYEDPKALYTYQLFDNGTGAYQYLTRYANDMVVVVNQKGNVVRYVTPDGLLYGPTWYLFGTVERRRVVDTNGDVLYTFISDDGDWNIFDSDGDLIAHLYSSSTPNNEWTIAEGCQRMLTFLATESKVVVDSSGSYTFTSKDGEKITSRVVVQANEAGVLQLQILDEDGNETYRITPSGGTYQVNYVNGVAFDTARAYETYSQGNMVLTRYWSTPYNRMMYSCTNDQLEGTFDDLAGSDQDGVPSPLASHGDVGGSDVRGVSHTGYSLLSDAGQPRTLSATATSEGTGDSSEAPMSSPDSIQDIMDSMSDYFDSVNGVLSKDTNTSKGDDLDPDNPLQMTHTETDGRQVANAVFSNPKAVSSTEMHALQDAYDYTQAITRVSKMYSLSRADMYKEAQEYAETRTKRIEAKKASFLDVMNRAKSRAEKSKG